MEKIYQLDVETAFLQSDVEETIDVTQPEGFEKQDSQTMKPWFVACTNSLYYVVCNLPKTGTAELRID